MTTLSEPILNAIKDVKRAELALKHARERLAAEIPDDWASEVHYNGLHAKGVPDEVVRALRGDQ